MCFTPSVSLATAITEFVFAGIMPFVFNRARLKNIFAFFLFLLGFYQFTEFMLCITGNAEVWVRAGYITYSFLPAVSVHAVWNYFETKAHRLLLYVIPLFYSFVALFSTDFVQVGSCQTMFVLTKVFYSKNYNTVFSLVYIAYYFFFIVFACLFALKKYRQEKNIKKKKLYLLLPLGVLLMSVPTFVFMVIFPSLNVMFPSVLCHFALLLAIVTFVGVYWEHKLAVESKEPV